MLKAALIFLIVALIAGALGLWGLAEVAKDIAIVIAVLFLVLFVIALIGGAVRGRRPV
jgi:uncharacterized membrane protein YtjA (UPF0391 family)